MWIHLIYKMLSPCTYIFHFFALLLDSSARVAVRGFRCCSCGWTTLLHGCIPWGPVWDLLFSEKNNNDVSGKGGRCRMVGSWQLWQESVSLTAKTQTAAKLPPKEDVSTLLLSPLNTEDLHSFSWLRADGQMLRPIARTLLFYTGLPFPKKSSLG